MRTSTFTIDPIIELLNDQTVASLPQIMAALPDASHRTVCRKLVQAGCRSSYSHRGRYYTLDELARFDSSGLWFFGDVRFSRAGSLMATLETLTAQSSAGYFADELARIVCVETHDALLKLVQSARLARTRFNRRYLYCSREDGQRQLGVRRMISAELCAEPPRDTSAEVRISEAAMSLLEVFDERQRRLFAGFESLRFGHGGDRRVADSFGMSVKTVAKGRKQLLRGGLDPSRIRKPGGGRRPIEKKTAQSPT